MITPLGQGSLGMNHLYSMWYWLGHVDLNCRTCDSLTHLSGTTVGLLELVGEFWICVFVASAEEESSHFTWRLTIKMTKMEYSGLLKPRGGTLWVSHLLYCIGSISLKVSGHSKEKQNTFLRQAVWGRAKNSRVQSQEDLPQEAMSLSCKNKQTNKNKNKTTTSLLPTPLQNLSHYSLGLL